MSVTIYQYKNCSTCRKAVKWLAANDVEHTSVPLLDSPPSLQELTAIYERSGLPLAKFFNTAGGSYRAGNWKVRRNETTEAEQLAALAADPMLVKRPLLVSDSLVLVGFKEPEYQRLLEG